METILSLTKWEKVTGIHVTKVHTGKMSGKRSLSTSVLQNPICQARRKNKDSICSKCYANKMLSGIYRTSEPCFAKNFAELQKPLMFFPKFPDSWKDFRFESFGDVASKTQALNYLKIMYCNPKVTFALWTKNPAIVDSAIAEIGKPKNMIYIQSSICINKVDPKYSDNIDKVFTVFDSWKSAEKAGMKINCEGKLKHLRCEDCNKCYNLRSKTVYINEIVK